VPSGDSSSGWRSVGPQLRVVSVLILTGKDVRHLGLIYLLHQLLDFIRAHRHAATTPNCKTAHSTTMRKRFHSDTMPPNPGSEPARMPCRLTGLRERQVGGRCPREDERKQRFGMFVATHGRAMPHGNRNGRNDQPQRRENKRRKTCGYGRQERREHDDGDAEDRDRLTRSGIHGPLFVSRRRMTVNRPCSPRFTLRRKSPRPPGCRRCGRFGRLFDDARGL
jgi:hypothetical protein